MLNDIIPEEKRKLYEIEQQILLLDNHNTTIKASDIYLSLNETNKKLEELDKLVSKESKYRKDDYRRRVSHLRSTYIHIKNSLDNIVRRQNRNNFTSQKQELFYTSTTNGGGHDDGDGNETTDLEARDLEKHIKESESLDRSNRMITEYISIGSNTLSTLYSQKERLKGIQRKAFDILSSLGIANSLMKMVEKRDSVDKWIVYAGMLLITMLILFIWWFYMK